MHQITTPDESPAVGWERTLYAFLAEKERRSGSLRTVQSYSRMLSDFFGRLAKTPDEVTSQDVFAWAYGTGPLGQAAGFDHHRRPDRLPQLVLPLPHPNEGRGLQPVRRPGATTGRPGLSTRLNAEQIRRLLDVDPVHAGRPAGPRDHLDTHPHGPAARRGARTEGWRHHAGRHALLLL